MLHAAFATLIAHLTRPSAGHVSLPTCDRVTLGRQMRSALGGALPEVARRLIVTGTMTADGLQTTVREVVDLQDGRTRRDERGAVRSFVVFDGRMEWERDWTGGVHALNGVDALQGARTDAYLRRYGYLDRADAAHLTCMPEPAVPSRYDVLSAVPRGGREVRLFIDRRSALLAKTLQRTATSTVSTSYDDYRHVDGFAIPFRITIKEAGSRRTIRVDRVAFDAKPFARTTFLPPSGVSEGTIVGAPSTTVPFFVEDGQALVEATVPGHRLIFQLDTGGHAIIMRDAASLLKLHIFGSGVSGGGGEATTALRYSRPLSFALRNARIRALPFYVLAYGRDFSDRGPGRAPRAGILGLEIFERFAVRLDYRSRSLTLTPLYRFAYRGNGTRLPLTFEGDTPLVPAYVDGSRGTFQADTGNSGGTILFGLFVRANHLDRRYPLRLTASGSGKGGDVHLSTRRLRKLSIDGLDLTNFITYFVDQRTGSFSSRSEAGNLGYDVLSNFTTTFDYLHRVAYLEPVPASSFPIYNRAGLVATRDAGRLVIDEILPASPGDEAGLVARDRLLEVDGRNGSNVMTKAFRALAHGTIGSRLRLTVLHAGRVRHVVLRLRELLCPKRAARCTPTVERAGDSGR